ncbi:hypothetical protein BU24DRAFT_415489 [Aaosphaeria arxii CBS 175.79]|uniref:Uncharacterized protein n=1 Tax=Aaosphaeria arxii CBS 175.79 TaxID=1450172 RepID=A0A6A5X747_9PLEO|nr:uncharacterized protein BU24DRAFT_415489 [Aaosphaeria arxii CBS 175.79]KAF2008740.1 hypothetical protein BU24DRAFT_415489 [Aaosphaeria arxii CBS 175.79]
MLFISNAVLLLSSLAPLVSQAAVVNPFSGYTVVSPKWRVELSPGQFEIFNGTMEEAITQAKVINPDFEVATEKRDFLMDRDVALGRRSNVICGQQPSNALKSRIEQNIAELRTRGANVLAYLGGRQCTRLLCTSGSANHFCNDNASPIAITWKDIADSIQHGINSCAATIDWFSAHNFQDGGWTTLSRGDDC